MTEILKICDCPNCGKPVDITEWNLIDPHFCVCGEQFEWEEVGLVRTMEKEKDV